MPTYKVLRPIEHNNQIYLPAQAAGTPPRLPSSGHGKEVATNTSGVIELTEEEAVALDPVTHGQVPVRDLKPESLEAAKAREVACQKAEAKESSPSSVVSSSVRRGF